MDRNKKWRATYRIICPLPKEDVPVELDAVDKVSVESSNRKESILTVIDVDESINPDTESKIEVSEKVDEKSDFDDSKISHNLPSVSEVTTPSRAASWLKPKVDYHPSSASKRAHFNTIDSSQTKNTQLTRSQTRTYSWIERKESKTLSEMTNSTVYTDKNPRIIPRRFTQDAQAISPSFQRRFGTNTSVTTVASSSNHIRISKTKLIILSIVIILVLILTIVLLVIFL